MLNLEHLFIPLIMFASLDYPYPSELPTSYRGTSNNTNGYRLVHPENTLGEAAGYGYYTDDDDTVSYNLRMYDFFTFVFDTAHDTEPQDITVTSGCGGSCSLISRSGLIEVPNGDDILANTDENDEQAFYHFGDDEVLLASAHVIVPDLDYVRNFKVSLHLHGLNEDVPDNWYSSYMFLLSDASAFLAAPYTFGLLERSFMVNTFAGGWQDLSIPNGYGVVIYRETPLIVGDSGYVGFFGYEVDSISTFSTAIPEDWGADNLLTLFGYLFVGMSGIFAISIFPGLTLGTMILFPLALGILSLVWKITGA